MTEYKVEIRNGVKKFKDVTALDHVSLTFETGKIHGLVGRNGSGKTVLMKCICGFMELTSGTILIDGKEVNPSTPRDIGTIIEAPGFLDHATGMKNLWYLASINRKITKEQVAETIRTVGLDPNSKKRVRAYSMGMRQRLGIAQAIMEHPSLLLLDEPMNGLDNRGVEDIRKVLMKLRDDGCTIILASHNHEDIDVLCDTVTEMDAGVAERSRDCAVPEKEPEE